MYKIYLHLFLWLMGIMVYCVMRTAGETSILKNISVLFILCALFFGLYYISYFMKNRKKEYSINSEGVLGGRGFGILLNFFIVEIILELEKKTVWSVSLIAVAIVVLYIFRKNVKSFWVENIWKKEFYYIYFSFTTFAAGVLGLLNKEYHIIDLGEVSNIAKIILLIFYLLIFWISEMPNSIIIRFSSKNEEIMHDER